MHGLIVGPTENPDFLPCRFNSTRLTRKDFPVLYFPTMEITPIFLFGLSVLKYYSASALSLKPSLGE